MDNLEGIENDFYILALLRVHGGRMTATEIAELMGLKRSTVSMIIKSACSKMRANMTRKGLKITDFSFKSDIKHVILDNNSVEIEV